MMHKLLLVAAMALGVVNGHMEMAYPAPFRGTNNPNSKNPDYSMTSPLSGASQFPCKGYDTDFADKTGAGAPTASWNAGGKYNFTITGGATHGGGSCQAALSYDGKTWTTIHSYVGSCPLSSGQNFDFTIPSDAKAGSAIFGWVWYNVVGNREIYMNCASVNIAAGSGDKPAVAFNSRPTLWVANLGNGCTTVEGKEVVFPDPGPDADVTVKKTVANDDGSFTGTCAAVDGVGGPAAAGSGSGTSPTGATPSGAAPSGAAPSGPAPSVSVASGSSPSGVSGAAPSYQPDAPAASGTASAPMASGTGTTNSSLQVSASGVCGETNKQTCVGSQFGKCCSTYGYCGDTTLHCGTGCVSAYGQCGDFLNSTATALTSSATPARKLIRFRRPRW